MSESIDLLDEPATTVRAGSTRATEVRAARAVVAEPGSPEATGRTRRRGAGLNGMVLSELQAMASSLGISGTARMRKSQLIEAIETGGATTAAPATTAGGRPSRNGAAAPVDATDGPPAARTRTEPVRAEPTRAEPVRAEPTRAEPVRA
ncbi:MAG: Rho termination factor N-terminal domain-containing protein, partial [Actinomycetes bacterium]